MAKFLFTADIHANKTRIKDVVKFFDKIKSIVKEKSIDCVIIGGDLWDLPVSNTKASGFTDVMSCIKDLTQIVDVIDITGTPSHESAGSTLFINALGGKTYDKPELIDYKGNKILLIPELRRGDFIRESSSQTNKDMNKYLSEVCKQKADIICYHGEISGALLDNGVAANSDVQLSTKMIIDTGAKLTLAGHIHTPQSLHNNIYYVGSPIPCNFGETHDGSVIYFESTDGVIKNFNRIYLGFPRNRTVECDLRLFSKLSQMNFKNVNVKVKLTLTNDERKFFHIHDEATKLKEQTSAESVSISIITTNSVSVRSKEITKTTSVLEKLKIYCDINNIELTNSIIDKAKSVEDKLLIKYTFPSHSMELISISLRGAKGLTGREQIDIDFTKYEDGVLAILGNNGAGKSTLLENCSPYPCLLTRSGSLRNHFYLKDSHRIVIYRDENGKMYKFTIQLAAHTDTGLVKYFAETSSDKGVTWNKVDEIDGNLDSYKKYVDSIFGSIAQYLRTAFFTTEKTKGYSDIATATKTEKMELISELLGVEGISNMHDMIKEEMKRISTDIDKLDGADEKKEQIESDIAEKNENLGFYKDELKSNEDDIKSVEEEIKQNKKDEDYYNEYYSKYGQKIKLKAEAEDNLIELKKHLTKLTEHKNNNDFFINNESKIKEYKEALDNFNITQEAVNSISKKLNKIEKDLLSASEEMNKAEDTYENEKYKYDDIDERIADAEEEIEDVSDVCPTCGAKLSEKKKKEFINAQKNIVSELKSLKEFKVKQKEVVSAAKKEYTSLKNKFLRLKENENKISKEYDEIDEKYQSTRSYIEINKKYEPFINYTLSENIDKDIENVKGEISRLEDFIGTIKDFEIVDYKQKGKELEDKRKHLEEFRLNNSVNIATIETQIKALKEEIEKISKQAEKIKVLTEEYKEYSVLEQAFSTTGIQALELEAASPNIAELTNLILHDSYGDKFSVSFSTLKQGKNKIIDDFSIDVTNHETGWTTPIELLSKGEKVWITEALYYAFSIIRMERTNFSFSVRFIDESDGGLDSDVRLKYFNMISSAHKAGNARLTVLITHSQEIKDIVQQVINL